MADIIGSEVIYEGNDPSVDGSEVGVVIEVPADFPGFVKVEFHDHITLLPYDELAFVGN